MSKYGVMFESLQLVSAFVLNPTVLKIALVQELFQVVSGM